MVKTAISYNVPVVSDVFACNIIIFSIIKYFPISETPPAGAGGHLLATSKKQA